MQIIYRIYIRYNNILRYVTPKKSVNMINWQELGQGKYTKITKKKNVKLGIRLKRK